MHHHVMAAPVQHHHHHHYAAPAPTQHHHQNHHHHAAAAAPVQHHQHHHHAPAAPVQQHQHHRHHHGGNHHGGGAAHHHKKHHRQNQNDSDLAIYPIIVPVLQITTSGMRTEDATLRLEREAERERRKNESSTYHELRAKFRARIDQASSESSWTVVNHQGGIIESSDPIDARSYDLTRSMDEQTLSEEKERLRRFLSHILSMSYNLDAQCPDRLRKEDWIHYLRLIKLAFEAYNSHHPTSRSSSIVLDWSDECCGHPDVDRWIKAPALALGLRRVRGSSNCSLPLC